jgi:hypothetical protein
VNRYGRELLDDDSDSLEGKCLLDRLTGPSRAGLAAALAAAEPGSTGASIEVSVLARATDERILQAKVRPHPAGSANMLLALIDVTEQRRSEAELAYTREILELSNRMARIGYWQVDLDTRAMNWSAVARDIYDLPAARGQTLAQTIDCCKDDAGRETLRHALAAAVAYGTTFDLELQITTPAGRDRWIRITGRADAADSPNRRLYGTIQDIDAHVEAESARVAQAGAEMANRSKTAFLARMSHDLRTPLNAVIGFSELLQLNRAAMSTPTVATQVRHIHRAGKHLLALIDEVLDLTRIESGDLHIVLEPVPLGALLDDCMTIAAPLAAERTLALRAPACHADASVLGDRTRLLQVLLNLLSNAVKYNREGGEVAIELGGDDDHVTIAVRDTGEGLTPEQLSQLFQPFNRLGAELRGIDGTGLGLVIAKQLVEAMGGQLEAQSTVGTGSVFTMRLRGSATGRAELARRPTHFGLRESGPGARPFVVLYVEDNPVNVEVMRAALAMRDHVEVEVAVDGRAGLDMAQRLRPDLILLDMGLPLMDGPAVFAHARRPGTGADSVRRRVGQCHGRRHQAGPGFRIRRLHRQAFRTATPARDAGSHDGGQARRLAGNSPIAAQVKSRFVGNSGRNARQAQSSPYRSAGWRSLHQRRLPPPHAGGGHAPAARRTHKVRHPRPRCRPGWRRPGAGAAAHDRPLAGSRAFRQGRPWSADRENPPPRGPTNPRAR